MRLNLLTIASIILFILEVDGAFSQPVKPYFKHISKDHGLSSNKVICIAQDKTGFMWFGTEMGLTRFDGSNFYNFKHNPSDKLSISDNYINCISPDSFNGNLWIGTNYGLNCLDLKKYIFNRNFKIPGKDSALLKQNIYSVLVDHNHNLWVGSRTGLYVYFYPNEIPVLYKPSSKNSITGIIVHYIFEDSGHNIWVATDKGLDKFDWATKRFKSVTLLNEPVNTVSVYEDSRKNIWVSTGFHGAFLIQQGRIKRYCKENKYLQENNVQAIIEDKKGNMYFAVRDGGGMHYLDYKTDKMTVFSPDNYDHNSISSGALTSLYRDKFGSIWIGTWRNGIDLIDVNKKAFKHYSVNFKSDGLINNNIRSLFQDSDGDIWVGSRDGGCLSKFNPATNTFVHYKNDKNNPYSLGSSFVLAIAEVSPGILLIGTFKNGLDMFNKRTGRFYHYVNNPSDPKSISNNYVYNILKDRHNTIWISTLNTLQKFDLKTKSFQSVAGISLVRAFVDYNDEGIYMGASKGLFFYSYKTQKFTNYKFPSNDSATVNNFHITGIRKDKKGDLWIATSGSGLFNFNTTTKKFKDYTENNGLSSNLACAVEVDNQNNIWVSTTNGLSKFDPATKKFRNYELSDGLQGNEFERYVSLKTKDGFLIFGGANGFNYFKPDEIKDNPVVPKVVITELKLFNQPAEVNSENSPLHEHISCTKEIVFNYKQSVISFEFVALNFTSSEKNQYAYQLEGFEDSWNYIGSEHSASYTNLLPGTYTFKVKASNNDGVWNDQFTSVKIKVLPPPWKSWWAYIFYLCIMVMVIYLLVKYANTRREFRLQLQIANIEKEKQEELNQIKLQFFTNISHEFKTPLTLILSSLKQIMDGRADVQSNQAYGFLQRNALRLQNLINQLMEFRKIETKNILPVYQKEDIVPFVKELLSIFKPVAKEHSLKLQFTSSPESIVTYFDSDKTEKILYNLLSNAIKFSPGKGIVSVSIALDVNADNSSRIIKIKVTNTGTPIEERQLPYIFETFYHIDRPKLLRQSNSGIGLAYTKELIELLEGSISVNSNSDETVFMVELPYREYVKVSSSVKLENVFTKSRFEYTWQQVETLKKIEKNLENNNATVKNVEILIVEDDREMREFLFNLFAEDYKVALATDGQQGLDLARQFNPALILSDIVMPRMNGIELCDKIKTDIGTSHIPVVLLTASEASETKIDGMETGADAYIEKPFDIDFLKLQVKNIIQTREAVRKAYAKKITPEPGTLTITSTDEQFVKKAITIVEENIDNPDFTVEHFGKTMNMSRTSLNMKIKALTDLSTNEFIINVRLKKAAQMLTETDLTVSEIAFRVGFNTPRYFSTSFKNHFKLTPLAFSLKNKPHPKVN